MGTQIQWGWHSFANPDRLTPEETLKEYDFGRGKKELYATQFKEEGRQQDAANWFRVNPHRLHLGIVGFDVEEGTDIEQVTDVHQKLCLWDGKIESRFKLNGEDYQVETVCHPSNDMIAANITSKAHTGICFRFPYPTGAHCDDACNWEAVDKHTTTIVTQNESSAVLKHTLDSTEYFVTLCWEGKATLNEKAKHYFVLTPMDDHLAFTCAFTSTAPSTQPVTVAQTQEEAKNYWNSFCKEGATVEF